MERWSVLSKMKLNSRSKSFDSSTMSLEATSTSLGICQKQIPPQIGIFILFGGFGFSGKHHLLHSDGDSDGNSGLPNGKRKEGVYKWMRQAHKEFFSEPTSLGMLPKQCKSALLSEHQVKSIRSFRHRCCPLAVVALLVTWSEKIYGFSIIV